MWLLVPTEGGWSVRCYRSKCNFNPLKVNVPVLHFILLSVGLFMLLVFK